MKTKKFNTKLSLKKKTVANLSDRELGSIYAGYGETEGGPAFCATLVEGCNTSTCHESRILYSCDCGSLPTTLFPFQSCVVC